MAKNSRKTYLVELRETEVTTRTQLIKAISDDEAREKAYEYEHKFSNDGQGGGWGAEVVHLEDVDGNDVELNEN